jgi:hypothetical protein
MKERHSIKIWAVIIMVFMAMVINGQAIGAGKQECWNLVYVKAEWKKINPAGKYIKVSPNGIRFNISTDGSWQWVEYDDPRFSGGRRSIYAGWSPPPDQYCYGSEMGITHKLTNKAINKKNTNVVASLSWGPDTIYGKGRKRITVRGSEAGKSTERKAIMHSGRSKTVPVWYAQVSCGNIIGQINYYYSPMGSKGQAVQKKQGSVTQQNNSSGATTAFANLNADNEAFIRSLYHSILDRQPDEGGVRNWKQHLDRGKSRAWVITHFFKSSEYVNRHKNNTEYVIDLYQGVLGRQPDPGGLSNWVNHLNSGKSREFVLNGFLNSQEYRSRTSQR